MDGVQLVTAIGGVSALVLNVGLWATVFNKVGRLEGKLDGANHVKKKLDEGCPLFGGDYKGHEASPDG